MKQFAIGKSSDVCYLPPGALRNRHPSRPMTFRFFISRLCRSVAGVAVLTFCLLGLTSCSVVGGLLDYLLGLPGALFNAICP